MHDAAATPPEAPAPVPDETTDLLDADQVARDLDGVELALARLDAGTYWTCEASGQPLPDHVLASDPTARRLPSM
jgi:RNA polymerase-binding transcription factor DksA